MGLIQIMEMAMENETSRTPHRKKRTKAIANPEVIPDPPTPEPPIAPDPPTLPETVPDPVPEEIVPPTP